MTATCRTGPMCTLRCFAAKFAMDTPDLLFLIFLHLRRQGLADTALSLLRESGVDPFWLCGPSKELALLREWILTGDLEKAKSLLTPFQSQLSTQDFAIVIGAIGRLQVFEQAFSYPDGASRRELLCTLHLKAREGVDNVDINQELSLTSSDAQQCLDEILSTSQADWSLSEARLKCFEVVAHTIRGEIDPNELEFKYEAVPANQLERLVQDALTLHARNGTDIHNLDCISLQTLSRGLEIRDFPSHALSLTAPAEKSRRKKQNVVSQSVDCLPPAPPTMIETPKLTSVKRERARRRRNPLVESIDERGLGAIVETELPKPMSVPKIAARDVGVNTEQSETLAAATSPIRPATPVRVPTGEMSIQTECEVFSQKHHQATSPLRIDDIPQPSSFAVSPQPSKDEEIIDPAEDHDDTGLLIDEDESDDESAVSDIQDEGLDVDQDILVDQEADSPIEYSKLSIDHIVRARVAAEAKEAHAVRAMDVHCEGNLVAIGTNARALRVLDVSTLAKECVVPSSSSYLPLLPVISEWHKHQRAPIYCVAFSQQPAEVPLLASGDADGNIKVLRLSSSGEAPHIFSGRHEGKLRSLQFSPGTCLLWSAAAIDRSIRCWDVARPSSSPLLAMDGHVGELQALAISSNMVASSAIDRSLRVWDARSGRCERLLASGLPHPALSLAFHPHTSQQLVAGHQDGSVSLWDLRGATFASTAWPIQQQTGKALVRVVRPHTDECRAISWAPSGRWLLSSSFDGSLCFMDSTGDAVASFKQHSDKILQTQWLPMSPAVVTTSADKTVKLWRFD